MTEKQPLGLLFDSVAYYTPNDINTLCDDMNFEQAYFYLTQALQHSFNSGVYTLQESEILSKSMRIISSRILEQK